MKKGVGSGVVSGSESGSISKRYGSGDPDPNQNVMDPQHCFLFRSNKRVLAALPRPHFPCATVIFTLH
jgi:hypothetical protein